MKRPGWKSNFIIKIIAVALCLLVTAGTVFQFHSHRQCTHSHILHFKLAWNMEDNEYEHPDFSHDLNHENHPDRNGHKECCGLHPSDCVPANDNRHNIPFLGNLDFTFILEQRLLVNEPELFSTAIYFDKRQKKETSSHQRLLASRAPPEILFL